MINKPNYNRKYKKRFYILLFLGIFCVLIFFINPFLENFINNIESKMVEGEDFFQETIVIDNKEIKKEVNVTLYDLFSTYTNGQIDKHYYLYSKNMEVLTDQVTYDGLIVGEEIEVYRSKHNKCFTSSIMAKRDSFEKGIELLFLANILTPALALLLLIYLFFLRKSLKNPYYSGK